MSKQLDTLLKESAQLEGEIRALQQRYDEKRAECHRLAQEAGAQFGVQKLDELRALYDQTEQQAATEMAKLAAANATVRAALDQANAALSQLITKAPA